MICNKLQVTSCKSFESEDSYNCEIEHDLRITQSGGKMYRFEMLI